MTIIGTQIIVGLMLFAVCSLTGGALAAPVIAAHTTEIEIDSLRARPANEGSVEAALTFRSDGGRFTLEFSRATRRQIVERLLATTGVAINWRDTVSAEERINGRHVGSVEEILRRLLSRTNYIVAYDMSDSEPRMISIVILGSGLPSANARTLQPVQAARPPPQTLDYAAGESAGSVQTSRPRRISEAAHERVRNQLRQARLKMLQKMKAAAERRRQ